MSPLMLPLRGLLPELKIRVRAPEKPISTPMILSHVSGSLSQIAANSIVMIGNIVVTIVASIGEVSDSPVRKSPWLNTNAKRAAPNSFNRSRRSTCSCSLTANEVSQKRIAPPLIRKNVRVKGLKVVMAFLAIGAIKPHIMVARKT